MFLSSVFTPRSSVPERLMEIFGSARSWPFSISASDAPIVCRSEVRLAHDLHQRHARAVEVDERLLSALQLVARVDELAGVLFEVDAPDAHAPLADVDEPVAAHRQVVLADLVTLRQVWIHV